MSEPEALMETAKALDRAGNLKFCDRIEVCKVEQLERIATALEALVLKAGK